MGLFENLFSLNNNKNSRKKGNAKGKSTFVKTSIHKPKARHNAPASLDVAPLSAMQKAHLVKKGHAFLKEGNTSMAHKIFAHLKVYEGLMRVSMAYYTQGKMEAAHGAAKEAWVHRSPENMTLSVSGALRMWLHPDEPNPAYDPPSAENRRAVLSAYQNRM